MVLSRALRAFSELVDPIATPISTGLIHETYEVRDREDHEFILQRVNPMFSRDINYNIQAVTRHLADRGIETFSLVESDGLPFIDLESDGLWRLMTRIKGTAFDRPKDPEQIRDAGRLVASFHRAMFDFDAALHPIGFPFHDTNQHFEDLAVALRENEGHPLHRKTVDLANKIFEAAAGLASLDAAPHRVIHGDLKFNNLLFEPESSTGNFRPVALIDLDTLARLPLAFDWGDALRSWCNLRAEDEPEAELDLSLASAATEGLMTVFEPGTPEEKPTPAELESLSWGLEIVSLELSARFASDMLRECHWDWDRNRFERAGEHNHLRALGQFDLYRQARATHEERAHNLPI
ncbi:MAG: aminoglycoside phosphotransferase family protein [Myxococcales bacterium]|nr:aminoglycoside phosphotransferase family protein [Myxococcales bacterium]